MSAPVVDKATVAKSYGVNPEGEPDAFRFVSKMLDFALPEPWKVHEDEQGRLFYWNPASRHSSWAHPLASTHKTLITAFRRIKQATLAGEDAQVLVLAEIEEFHKQGEEEISFWRVSRAPDGTAYYYKAGTQETRWDNPRDELVCHQELRIRMLSELLESKSAAKAVQGQGLLIPRIEMTQRPDDEASRDGYDLPQNQESVQPKSLQVAFDACTPAPGALAAAVALPRDEGVGSASKQLTAIQAQSPGPAAAQEQTQVPLPLRRAAEDPVGTLYDGADVRWVKTDELALKLGLSFDNESDRASFHILEPILAMSLPAPWRGIRDDTSRIDFYHPGTEEKRQEHPMFSFFKELVVFLRDMATSDAAFSDSLTAQVFREASPQIVRERLGVWEGPLDVAQEGRRAIQCYEKLLVGSDSACVAGNSRRDDPRMEAAGNMTARFDAWYHLWNGFCPDETFPFAGSRLSALVTQLSESVVLRPGDRADRETVLHQWNWALERRSPLVPEMQVPLTAEEESVQHEVTALLGAAYGVAFAVLAAHEAPYAKSSVITTGILKNVYRTAASRDFDAKSNYSEDDAGFEELDDTLEQEDEEDYGEMDDEYEDDEDVGEDSATSDAEAALPAAQLASQDEEVRLASLEEEAKEEQEFLEELEDGDADKLRSFQAEPDYCSELPGITEEQEQGEEADAEDDDAAQRAARRNEDVELFLALEEPADKWAEFGLRPLSPRPQTLEPEQESKSPPKDVMQRPKGFDEEVWDNRNFLRNAIIKPFVSDLGWRCHYEIMKGMWTEAEETPEVSAQSEPASPTSGSAGPSIPPSPSRTFRGVAVPPVALDKVKAAAAVEVDSFKASLESSQDFFDKCLSSRGPHPGLNRVQTRQSLIQPELDMKRPRLRVLERSELVRPDIPDRDKVRQTSIQDELYDGGVAPAHSPSNQLREPIPNPPYLQGQLLKNKWGIMGDERPRSAERIPLDRRDLRMRLAPRVRSADGRARKADASFVAEVPEIGARMASEKVKLFLSRKCGRIETAFEQIDTTGRGFITLQDWLNGLHKLEYDHMEYAQGIFKILDSRQHHVLTLSDLTARKAPIYEGMPEPEAVSDATAEMLAILGEVLGEEVNAIVKKSLESIALSALRAPQPPLRERADVGHWLKTRRKPKAKKQAKQETQEQEQGTEQQEQEEIDEKEESESDPEKEILEAMNAPAESKEKDKPPKKLKKLKAAAKMIQAQKQVINMAQKMPKTKTQMPKVGNEADSESDSAEKEMSRRTPDGSRRDTSPTSRSPVPKKAAGKTVAPVKRKVGVMAMMLQLGKDQDDSEAVEELATQPDYNARAEARRSTGGFQGMSAQARRKTLPSPREKDQRSSSNPNRRRSEGAKPKSKEGKRISAKTITEPVAPERSVAPEQSVAQERSDAEEQPMPALQERELVEAAPQSVVQLRSDPEQPAPLPNQERPWEQGRSEGMRNGRPQQEVRSTLGPVTSRSEDSLSPGRDGAPASQMSGRSSDGGAHARTTQGQKAATSPAFNPKGGYAKTAKEKRYEEGGIMSDGSWMPHKQEHLSPRIKPKQQRVVQVGRRAQESQSPPRMQQGGWMQQGGSQGSQPGRQPKQDSTVIGARQLLVESAGDLDAEAQPQSSMPSQRQGHNLFAVGFNGPRNPGRPVERLLPYVPRRPQDVCKTYSHIFKLLNDPHAPQGAKKRMPKQKQAVHVSMPRLPAAGAAGASNGFDPDFSSADELAPLMMFGSKSSPNLTSMTSTTASASSQQEWQSASMRADVENVGADHDRIRLPPLAGTR